MNISRIKIGSLFFAAHPQRCLRFISGMFLALAWLAFSAAQAQTTNYELGTTALLVGPAAASNSVLVALTPTNGAWTATTNVPWLHLSGANQSGTGSTSVVFSFDSNTGTTRSGSLTIGGQTLTVTQAGSTYVVAGKVTTLASAGELQNPDGVGVDGAGNVYFVDSENNALYKWTLTNQTLTTLSSAFGSPNGVALDSAGNVYVSDWTEVTVKKWSLASQSVTKTLFFPLPGPTGVAVGGAGNVFVPFARRDL
jgi:hypothetical protein